MIAMVRPMLLPLIGILVGGLVLFMVAPRFLGSPAAEPSAPAARAPAKHYEGGTLRIKERIFNLQDPNARRYLKLGVALVFEAETDKYEKAAGEEKHKLNVEFEKEADPHKDFIQDTLISVVSSKTMAQVLSPEGKDSLREEIVSRLNAGLHGEKVMKVLFTEFVIQ